MLTASHQVARARVVAKNWKPRNCVWELTLACNLDCTHCGSRAGKIRKDELSLDECLRVADELVEQGCELVSLSGGEPTLRRGWDQIARRLVDGGVYVNMVTNGVYSSEARGRAIARQAKEAGLCNVAVSIDGPSRIHDAIRDEGTFEQTVRSIGWFREVGLPVAVLTTVNRINLPLLAQVREIAMDAGASQWRLQLAKPMGKMSEEQIIDPEDLLTLMPQLAEMKKAGGINLRVGDSIGYYGPHDKVLRGRGWRGRKECWQGCQAGMQAIGIEADGGVKGCLSLQAKWGDCDPFVEGNLREQSLEAIWHSPGIFAFNRDFAVEKLTGVCAGCRHGALCRGGARCVSAAVGQTLTEDPYCYYRLASEARREWRPGSRHIAVAALAASIAQAACQEDSNGADAVAADPTPRDVAGSTPSVDAGELLPDAERLEPDGAMVEPDGAMVEPDGAMVEPDAAMVEPDGAMVEPDAAMVEPDAAMSEPDAAMSEPDAMLEPDAAGIACDAVCCECEYGVIPDEIWEACCAPDPCADVCCECDYGDPPPAECCN